jgi:hypothetical protein
MARKVIELGGPGLGDWLSYSTLPEELTRQGHEVWIKPSVWGWRNPEVQALVAANPFVAGFTDEPGSKFTRYENREPRSYPSWIMGMENEYGCKPTNAWPKTYMQPAIREDWAGRVFLDPRSSSQPFPRDVIDEYVHKVGYQLAFDPADVTVIESPYSCANGHDAMRHNRRLHVPGLADYASAIASCAIFLTVESGGHMFASAIKGGNETPNVVSLFTNRQINDVVFHMGNVSYRAAGDIAPDWHPYR